MSNPNTWTVKQICDDIVTTVAVGTPGSTECNGFAYLIDSTKNTPYWWQNFTAAVTEETDVHSSDPWILNQAYSAQYYIDNCNSVGNAEDAGKVIMMQGINKQVDVPQNNICTVDYSAATATPIEVPKKKNRPT